MPFLNEKMKMLIVTALLFFILTPGMLLTLPFPKAKEGDKVESMSNAAFHAAVFAVVLFLVGKYVKM